MPVQLPDQPVNITHAGVVAVSVTTVPVSKVFVHESLHVISGWLAREIVNVLEPLPVAVIANCGYIPYPPNEMLLAVA